MIDVQTYHHFFRLPHHKHNKLSSFYIAAVLRSFVLSFLVLFLPVIIMNNYLAYGMRNAIAIAIGYFLFAAVCQTFSIVLASKAASLWGLRMNFLISQVSLVIFLIVVENYYYALGFFFLSIAAMFWWYSYHIYFTDFGIKKEFGREVGIMEAVSVLSGAIAPIIGGFILVNHGSLPFYSLGILTIMISLIFIFSFEEPAKLKAISFKDIIRTTHRNSDDFIAFVGAGAEEAISTIIWPILLYLIFKDYFSVGTYFSMVMIGVVAVNYLVGFMADSPKKEKLEEIGSVAVFFSWLMRAFVQHPLLLSLVEIVYKLFLSFFKLPLLVIAYDHAYHEKEDYIAFREFAYKVGAFTGYIFFIAILLANLPLWTILIFSAGFSLLPMRIARGRKILPDVVPKEIKKL